MVGRAEDGEAEAAGFPQAELGCRKEIANPRRRDSLLIFRISFWQMPSPSAGLCLNARLWKEAPPKPQQQRLAQALGETQQHLYRNLGLL